MPGVSLHTLARRTAAAVVIAMLAACQSIPDFSAPESGFEGPGFSDETRQMEAELMREAATLGAVQGAAGIAASFDRSGVASLMLMQAGQAARNALMRKGDERMREQLKKDNAEFLRQYGITEEDDPEMAPDPISPAPASALPFPSHPAGCRAAADGRRRC